MSAWPESSLQYGWTGDQLVAWWWDGRTGLKGPAASLASSRLYNELVSRWGQLPVGAGGCRVRVRLPDEEVVLAAISLPPAAWPAPGGQGRRRPSTDSSRWVSEVMGLARHLLEAGHVLPQLERRVGTPWQARWRPVWSLGVEEYLEALAARQPPVCRALSSLDGEPMPEDPLEFTHAMLEWMVDEIARLTLRQARWAPDLRGQRGTEVTAARGVSSALVRADAFVPELANGPEAMLPALSEAFLTIRAKALGEPVVAGRLRLSLPPDDARGEDPPWGLSIELFDRTDTARWCTAADVLEANPLALDLAGDSVHLARLAEAVRQTAQRVASINGLRDVVEPWIGTFPEPLELGVAAASLVLQAVPELQALGVELLVPGQLLPATAKVRGTARAGGGAGLGRLGASSLVDWSMVVGDEEITEAALDRAVSAGASLLQVNGRWVRLDPAAARKALEELTQHRRDHREVDAVTLLRLAAGGTEDDPLVVPETASGTGPSDDDGRDWIGLLLSGLGDASLEEGHEPAGFEATLRPYQRRGLGWLQFLARLGFGACLADDMGLGKTPTTLAHLVSRPGPHLVICPLSVVRNWESEAARFTPFMRTVVHHGSDRLRGARLTAAVAGAELVISTYGLVTRDIEELSAIEWTTVVLDEAQAVKNPHTKTARAVRKLRAAQKVALTGTPVENRLAELWAILDVVNPGLLGSEKSFQDRWATPIEKHQDLEVAAQLRRLTGPCVLRRTKADRSLVPDLPDKVEQTAWATLTKEQAAMYQAVVDELLKAAEEASGIQRRGLVLGALTRLKQICNHPAHALGDGSRLAGRSGKLARFDELVADLLEADERALVFTQYREMGLLLQRHLVEQFGLAAPFLHGGVSKSRRDRMVDEFQAGTAPPLLLVSLKAGGTGLNLTAASRVVHYDRWWNPAVEDQATDRAWRIGQKQSVFVHKLVCQGTLEERIAQLIDDKRRLAGLVIGGGEDWLTELGTDQLRELVVLGAGALG